TELRRRTGAEVAAFIERNAERNVIFSAEGLSYLRHDDEIGYLAGLLEPRRTTVILYRRDKGEFLRSYRAELQREGWPPSSDRDSYAYCESDTWLAEFDNLIDAYAGRFPDIRVMPYNEIVARAGTIIPSFLDEIGIRDYDPASTLLLLN